MDSQNRTGRNPDQRATAGRKAAKRWSMWLVATILILLLAVIFRAILPELVRDSLNSELADLNNYRGHIDDVDIHLWRGAFSLNGIEVVMTDEDVPAPFVDIDTIDVSVSWSDLIQGAIVAEVDFYEPIVNFVDTRHEVDQTGEGTDWRAALQQLVPININHIGIVDGRVHFRNFISDPPVDLELASVDASIVNLTNLDRTEGPQLARVEAQGLMANQAPVELSARLDPLGDFSNFDIQLHIQNLELTRLNALTRAYGNFDFQSGTGSFIMELEAENAQLTGYVKPLLDNVEILDFDESIEERGVLGALWESIVAGLGWLFRNHPEDRIGAQVEIRGNLDQQDVSAWQAFVSVLRNAFVEAYEEAFGRE